MKSERRFDIVIIGGGIVGTATAMALVKGSKISLAVVEAEDRLAFHQTGHNSGVIHSGIYYKPGSLKAKLCVEGREAMYTFCREHKLPHEKCGKIIVATRENELAYLDELEQRARVNGLQDVQRLTAAQIKQHEPQAAGISGLYVPQTGIVDYTKVVEVYAKIIRESGDEIITNARVTGIARSANDIILATGQGEIFCHHLINCAGLYSDRVARMSGTNPGLQIIPFRGEYYRLNPARRGLVRNLIYPVPDPQFPFLGVHFTRGVDGQVEAGPNAVLAFSREGYRKLDISILELANMALYPAFWKMAKRYWRLGFGEFHRSLNKPAFVKELQGLIPELKEDDLIAGGSGVRAQALEPDGTLVDDFRIVESEEMIHVLNAPSPAATASIKIGELIADLATKKFGLN